MHRERLPLGQRPQEHDERDDADDADPEQPEDIVEGHHQSVALDRPGASPASRGGTEVIAAWLRNRKPRIEPIPRSNCESTNCAPVACAVSVVSSRQLPAMIASPAATAKRMSK